MDKLATANKRLKTASDNYDRDYGAEIAKLESKENSIKERLAELDKKKLETARANGNEDVAAEDMVEINAGGKIIAAKRSTLTQLKGTRMETLFSGRWDKKLQRDNDGRIFLDVNPECFQAIVYHLHEMAISSEDNPPEPPSVDVEHTPILKHQLELFGLNSFDDDGAVDCKIIKNEGSLTQLHGWLKEDGSDGDFSLLYRGTRDGHTAQAFHSKCDNKGSTITIIETTCGHIFGGYSNVKWESNNQWESSDKAFLFALSGSPRKMKLNGRYNNNAIYNHASYGPTFGAGNDLRVQGSTLTSSAHSYASSRIGQLGGSNMQIKEIEVFQVIPGNAAATAKKQSSKTLTLKAKQVNNFSKEINDAVNAKWVSLCEAEQELLRLEDSFKDEGTFTSFFVSGQPQDFVTLNVCGTFMATRLSTLQLCKESILASKFLVDQQNMHSQDKTIEEWNNEDVVAWLNQIEGVSEAVVDEFEENRVTGQELLVLGADGLKDFGVARKGTIYLLLDKIKKLEKAGKDSAVLIEHSPYCFQKILDHLRLEKSFMKGLVKTKHGMPVVRSNEQGRYQKVLNHLFPGESSNIFRDA